jgi:hypothetical protein
LSESSSCAIARFARSDSFWVVNLGFRSAPPQALCLHPLRGFWKGKPTLTCSEIHEDLSDN